MKLRYFGHFLGSNMAVSNTSQWSWYAWQDSNLRPFAPEAPAPFPFLSFIAFLSIVLHQFGASAFARSRTPFPPITYTFGTLLAHLHGTHRGPDSNVHRPRGRLFHPPPIRLAVHRSHPAQSQKAPFHLPRARGTQKRPARTRLPRSPFHPLWHSSAAPPDRPTNTYP